MIRGARCEDAEYLEGVGNGRVVDDDYLAQVLPHRTDVFQKVAVLPTAMRVRVLSSYVPTRMLWCIAVCLLSCGALLFQVMVASCSGVPSTALTLAINSPYS